MRMRSGWGVIPQRRILMGTGSVINMRSRSGATTVVAGAIAVAEAATVARETVAVIVVVTAAREAVAATVAVTVTVVTGVIAAAEARGIEIAAPGMIAENGEIPMMTVVAHSPTGTMRAAGKIAVNAVHGGLLVVMMAADGGQVRRADANDRPFRRRLVTKTTR